MAATQDELEMMDAFASGAGYPVPSWDTLGVGGEVRGVILPQKHPKTGEQVSYVTTQQTDMESGEPLWWERRDGTQVPRPQYEFHIQTGWRNNEGYSSNRLETALEDEEHEDDGLRRVIVKGKTATQSMTAAGKKLFKGRPPVGAMFSQKLESKKPIPGSKYKENIFTVSFGAPDEESLAIAQKHWASLSEDAKAFEDDDLFTTEDASEPDDGEPPF